MTEITFKTLATMSQEERGRAYIETAIDDFIADIIHQYQWGELDHYGYSERSFGIVDELGMTQEIILETLERKLDISYQFKIDKNMFSYGNHIAVRIDNENIHKYFKNHVKEIKII